MDDLEAVKNNDQQAQDKANVDVQVFFVHYKAQGPEDDGPAKTHLYDLQVKFPGPGKVGSMLRKGIEESFSACSGTPISVCRVPVGRGRKKSSWIASLPLEELAKLIARSHGWALETDPNPYQGEVDADQT